MEKADQSDAHGSENVPVSATGRSESWLSTILRFMRPQMELPEKKPYDPLAPENQPQQLDPARVSPSELFIDRHSLVDPKVQLMVADAREIDIEDSLASPSAPRRGGHPAASKSR